MSEETNHPQPERSRGLNPLDTLSMSRGVLLIVGWLSRHRQPATIAQIVEGTGRPLEKIERDIALLLAEGHIQTSQVNGETLYEVIFRGKITRSGRGVSGDIWASVDTDQSPL